MRLLLSLLMLAAVLPAEEIQLQSGGSVAPAAVPGFVAVNVSGTPAATHLVRVGAISHLSVPRPDRPGDVLVLVIPGATETLRIVVPVRVQAPEAVLAALTQASVAPGAPGR